MTPLPRRPGKMLMILEADASSLSHVFSICYFSRAPPWLPWKSTINLHYSIFIYCNAIIYSPLQRYWKGKVNSLVFAIHWRRLSLRSKDDHPKRTANTTKHFIRARKWKVLDWPSQSPALNPIEHAFHLLKRRLKGKPQPWNKPQQKEAAVKTWKSITKEEWDSLVMSVGRRLDAMIASKGYATKY